MYRANLIARNLHASSENRRKQERLFVNSPGINPLL